MTGIGTRVRLHGNRSTTEMCPHSIGDAEREAMAIFETMAREPEVILTRPLTQKKKRS